MALYCVCVRGEGGGGGELLQQANQALQKSEEALEVGYGFVVCVCVRERGGGGGGELLQQANQALQKSEEALEVVCDFVLCV